MNSFNFWLAICILGVLAIGGYAVISNRYIRVAFAIFILFCLVAGFYLGIGADYVAAAQLFIYVGAILLTLMMGLMLTQSSSSGPSYVGWRSRINAIFILFIVLGICFSFESSSVFGEYMTNNINNEEQAIILLSQHLFIAYGVLIEWLSLLLLIALIGAIYFSRFRTSSP